VVRTGDVLARIGKMAELFDDFSPLQLQASGTYQGKKFTLVGRLQYKYADGTWTEWYAAFDDPAQGVAYLSEDNGAFVFTLPTGLQRNVPPADQLRVGATTAIDGKSFSVASVHDVALMSAQGELPRLPALGEQFAMVELRSADGEVFSIDYGTVASGGMPSLSRGKAVLLDDLKLTGLKGASGKEDKGQQFACPNCGAQISVALGSSKTITCRSCNSVIDLSQGVGGQLKHALQNEPVELLIPLGTIGLLQGVSWQVVGFQHRMGNEPGDDEHFGWSEYLLYNQKRGFIFLVDAEDGWSLVKPATGAPVYKPGAQSATYLGAAYSLQSTYTAETNYVAGEFYWQVKRGEKTSNADFTKGRDVLSREQAPGEVTWSSGSKLDGRVVAAAFKLDENKELFKRVDAQPLSQGAGMSVTTIVVVVIVLIVLSLLMTRCSSCDPNTQNCSSSGARTSGGAYGGGFSSGGHK
jgi:Domain of unknown function (DUF4178)